MLRTLIQKKENLRSKMSELWKVKEEGKEWSNEQRSEYDKLHEQVKKIDDDIKLRSEYVENFRHKEDKEDKKFKQLENRASIFNIIKRQAFEMTNDSRLKIDGGPINEVMQERSKNIDSQFIKPGEVLVPLNSFGIKKRATLSTAAGSGENLVEDTIYPEIIKNLYEKSWAGRLGVDIIENWRGNFLMPSEDTKPASGFIAETADYPESSIDYKAAISLAPLKVGALQPFSLQSFMQDETRQLENSINSQLMKEWAKKVDDDFLNADGSPVTEPKGLLNITGIQSIDVTGSNGGPVTFAKCLEAEGKLRENNQDMPPVWLINSKTLVHARGTLKNNVAGANYIATTKMFADRRFVESNVVKSNLTKGSSGAVLSQALLIVPESVVIVQWAMPAISIDRSLGFKNDTIWTKISGYVNIGVKRPKDIVNFKNIKTS